jgi:hypothetical protein
MTEIKICTPDEVDLQAYADMQQESFRELLAEMGVSGDFMTPEFYRWKYNPPSGPAKVILGLKEDRIVTATMLQPLVLRHQGRRFTAWQNGDTATLAEFRCLGLYPRCMKAAVRSVQEDELLFGFPNKNSIRGFSFFVKTGKGVVRLLAKLHLRPSWLSRSADCTRVTSFLGGDFAFDFSDLSSDELPVMEKTPAYLEWRYLQHPVHQYHAFVRRDPSGAIRAIAVLREAEIRGKKATMVMELLGRDVRSMRRVLHHALAEAKTSRILMAYNTALTRDRAFRLGFVTVPMRFIPKQQSLFASANGVDAQAVLALPWQLQMGDWDGF